MTKKCPSCFIHHLPTECSGEKPPAAEIKKSCPSCFISHAPSECDTIAVKIFLNTPTISKPHQPPLTLSGTTKTITMPPAPTALVYEKSKKTSLVQVTPPKIITTEFRVEKLLSAEDFKKLAGY